MNIVDGAAIAGGYAYTRFTGAQDTDIFEPDIPKRHYCLRTELQRIVAAADKTVSYVYVFA